MTTVFTTVASFDMEGAYRDLTLDEYVDYIWRLRRREIARRNAWNLIRYYSRRGHVRPPVTSRRPVVQDVKDALLYVIGALVVVLGVGLLFGGGL